MTSGAPRRRSSRRPLSLTPVAWAQAATHARSPLSWRARCVALALGSHADPGSMSSKAGIAQLVVWTGLGRTTVKAGRRELIASGFVLLARSRTVAGDEGAAVHLLRIPAAATVDKAEEVGSVATHGGSPHDPPPTAAEHEGGSPHDPHESSKGLSKPAGTPASVETGCHLGPRRCPFCRRGLEHPP